MAAGLVDLVEHAAVGEMGGLRLGPAAEIAVDRGKRDGRETGRLYLARISRIARTIEILRLDLLRLRRIEEFQEGLRGGAAFVPVDILVDQRHRRLGQNGTRGIDDLDTGRGASFSARCASFSQASSTSPMPRLVKVVVEPRAPESSTGTC